MSLGKNHQLARRKLFGVSLATAFGHAGLSVVLGVAVVAVELAFSSLVSLYLTISIGYAMVAIGLIIGVRSLVARHAAKTPGQELEEEKKVLEHEKPSSRDSGFKGISYFAVLGAALSPDLSITPVFLSAIPAGLIAAIDLSVVFAVASILSLVILVQAGTLGLAKTFERVPEKYNDSLIGFVIVAVGIYVIVAG